MHKSSGLAVQAWAALAIGLGGLARRWWSSLNAVLGTAIVVGVLLALLAIGAGYADALRLADASDNLLILRAGARSEMESSLTGEQVRLIAKAAVFAKRRPPAAEVYAVASLDGADGHSANVAVRGLAVPSLALRPDAVLVAGRMFVPGRRELVVGRLAQRRFPSLQRRLDASLRGRRVADRRRGRGERRRQFRAVGRRADGPGRVQPRR